MSHTLVPMTNELVTRCLVALADRAEKFIDAPEIRDAYTAARSELLRNYSRGQYIHDNPVRVIVEEAPYTGVPL